MTYQDVVEFLRVTSYIIINLVGIIAIILGILAIDLMRVAKKKLNEIGDMYKDLHTRAIHLMDELGSGTAGIAAGLATGAFKAMTGAFSSKHKNRRSLVRQIIDSF